jgi:hypothetical protein
LAAPELPAEKAPEKKGGEGAIDLEAMRKTVMASLTESFRDSPPNRRGTGLRLSATAAAASGDFTAAQEQLAQFRVVRELAPYQFEAIQPLTQLAWKHLQAGRQAVFLEAVVSAGEATRKLPPRGRVASQAAIMLAAVMAVADRKGEAMELIATHRNGNELDDLAAALAIAQEDGTFDLSHQRSGQTLGHWQRPLTAAVTYILVTRRQNKTAETWVREQADEVARNESQLLRASLIAEQTLTARPLADSSLATLPGLDLSADTEMRWHARLATLYLAHGLKPAAGQSLDQARRILPQFTIPATVHIKGVKELLSYELPPANPLGLATAVTAAELAYAQARLGRLDEATASLGAALAQWRSTAPSLIALQNIEKSILGGGPSAARQKLRQVLELETEDTAARELTRLRQKLARLQPAAELRFRNQEKLLTVAMQWGLLDAVWKEVQLRHRDADPNEQEPYLRSALPQLLARRFAMAQQTTQQQEVETLLARIEAALGSPPTIDDPLPLLEERVGVLAAAGNMRDAGRLLNTQFHGEDGELPLWTLRLTCQLAANGQFDKVVELLSPIQQATIREEGFRLAAAIATLQGQHQKVLAAAQARNAEFPLEAAAMYAGILEALPRRPADGGKPVTPQNSRR